ncbi:MAG: hypothetical protein ACI906_003054 [Candidatus Latescibacterota bacterium]|jgi:hypothetical protein
MPFYSNLGRALIGKELDEHGNGETYKSRYDYKAYSLVVRGEYSR